MADIESIAARLSPPPRRSALQGVVHPSGTAHIHTSDLLDDATRKRLGELCKARGLAVAATATGAGLIIRIQSADGADGDLGPVDALKRNPEAYWLAVVETQGTVQITIAASDARGVAMASRTLAQMWDEEGLATGRVLDWPSAEIRGLIEGFYGEPWEPEARLGMLSFIAERKFNTFVYGPKDDKFHRDFWRKPYPDEELAHVHEQFETCQSEGLRFVYSLGPGLDICYSKQDDVDQILTKYRSMFELGVRHFGLYFDDIPYVFLEEADVPVYGEATMEDMTPLGAAQADVTAKVFEELRRWDPECSLIFCPIEYWGDCDSGYVGALKDGLPAEVDLFYTGPQICSCVLETSHTAGVSDRFGRPVTFWDNYPVNDAAMTGRLHLAPLLGRDPDLFTAARGLICNPMPYCEASKFAVGTIGEYLWNTEAYEPDAAFDRAAKALVTEPEIPHLHAFIDNMYFSCLHEVESEKLASLIGNVQSAHANGGAGDAARELGHHLQDLAQSVRVLERISNKALRKEMTPWIRAMASRVRLCRRALAVIGAPAERIAQEREYLEETRERAAAIKEEPLGSHADDFAAWALERIT